MATTPQRIYEFELWVGGQLVADISQLCTDRSYKIKRNDSEELDFTLNTLAFEEFCDDAGINPYNSLLPYVTDIRVKRKGIYKFGVHLQPIDFSGDDSGENIRIQATGFLDLFSKRYVSLTQTQIDASQIAWNLINATQSIDTYHNFGVTKSGAQFYLTGKLRDRDGDSSYKDQNVKSGIVDLTNLVDGNFDFNFTYDRVFETYAKIGSDRPNLPLIWPFNIKGYSFKRDPTPLYNYVTGIGSGIGDDAVRTSPIVDATSELAYKAREEIVTFNSVGDLDVLTTNTTGELNQVKELLQLPKIFVRGDFLDSGGWIGDRIPLSFPNRPFLNIDGTYRLEEIDVSIDENDAEDITLIFDDYGVS